MRKTYKFRIYPTKQQQEKIMFTLERCLFLYNRLLEERRLAYETSKVTLNYYDQANTLNERKKHIPALKLVHSQVLQDVAKRLDKAFQAFFRRIKTGEIAGFPRFKSPHRYNSFTYPQSGYSIKGGKLKLSKIGDVKIKLHRQPKGTVKTCAIVIKNGKFYACLSCELEPERLPLTEERVGVDLGVRHFAITSDGTFFDSPKYLRKSELALKRLHRSMSRKQRGSNRYKKATLLLAKLYERVTNQRKDYAHKVSKQLTKNYSLIVFEDLKIKNMVKNHRLAKSIHDAGWGQLVQFTMYKAEEAGRRIVLVDPKNTSQECSNCGELVKKALSVRVHRCPHCGFTMDRDQNAAINILKRAL